jgi:Sulfatase
MQKLFQKAKQFLGKQPLFLLLLPLFFIYSGYNELFGFLSFRFVLWNFTIILIIVSVLLFLSYWLLRNFSKSSIFTFFISLFCLVFGYLHDSLKQFFPESIFVKFTFLLPGLLALWVAIFFLIKKRKSSYGELYLFLNLLFIILLFSEIPNSIKRYHLDKSVNNLIDFRFNASRDYKSTFDTSDSLKPDIYFLVFDALASSKSIEKLLNRKNYSLDSFLGQKQFYVASNARANYNFTVHSISTTFNMDYLPPWIVPVMNDPKAYFWGSASILNNSLFTILKKEGYAIHNYQPISFDNKDWPGDSFFDNIKKYHYPFKTLPGRIYRDIFWNYNRINIDFIRKKQFDIVDKNNKLKKTDFDTTVALLKQTCRSNKLKFVYGHFMIPHELYTFDSAGIVKQAANTVVHTKEEDAKGYFGQVQFAGKVIRELVDYIQLNNKKNTIIIIAGDHGLKSAAALESGYTFNNLMSIYFPDKDYSMLYDSVSPVNIFRIVLNKHFKAGLPLHKDSSVVVKASDQTIKKSEKILPTHTPSTPNQ